MSAPELTPALFPRTIPAMTSQEQGFHDFAAFAARLKGDEKSEAQTFLFHLLEAFNHDPNTLPENSTFEYRVRFPGQKTKDADFVWPARVLVEMKSRGVKLSRHYQQTFDYWLNLVPHRPPYVVLCNFDEFWIYDFTTQMHEPLDRVPVKDLAARHSALSFLYPRKSTPIFGNNWVDVTREAANDVALAFNEMLKIIVPLPRFIACARVTKRLIFEFLSSKIRPDSSLTVFAFADDYSFGIVQSGLHWAWFTAKCSTLTERFRYTSDTVFDTFPWPQLPTLKNIRAVAEAARALRTMRCEIMDANGWSLRELYKSLDTAVRAAYGMKPDEDILAFLLKLNLELAETEAKGERITPPGLPPHYPDSQALVTEDCIRPPSAYPPFEPVDPRPLPKPNPDQARADAAHVYFLAKEEGPPYDANQ